MRPKVQPALSILALKKMLGGPLSFAMSSNLPTFWCTFSPFKQIFGRFLGDFWAIFGTISEQISGQISVLFHFWGFASSSPALRQLVNEHANQPNAPIDDTKTANELIWGPSGGRGLTLTGALREERTRPLYQGAHQNSQARISLNSQPFSADRRRNVAT